MKFCPSCGIELPDDVKLEFCTDCGASLQLPEKKKSPIATAGQVLIKVFIVLAGSAGLLFIFIIVLFFSVLGGTEC